MRKSPKAFKPRKEKMIMFDREARVNFVTGFRARKDERRFEAKIKATEEKKEERRELVK